MHLAIHIARCGLLGVLPNPLLIAEVPSAAARFANAFCSYFANNEKALIFCYLAGSVRQFLPQNKI